MNTQQHIFGFPQDRLLSLKLQFAEKGITRVNEYITSNKLERYCSRKVKINQNGIPVQEDSFYSGWTSYSPGAEPPDYTKQKPMSINYVIEDEAIISKIITDDKGINFKTFHYQFDDQLISRILIKKENFLSVINFKYEQSRLIRIEHEQSYKNNKLNSQFTEFEWTDNLISQRKEFYNNELLSSESFFYNAQGQLTHSEEIIGDKSSRAKDFQYIDSRSDIISSIKDNRNGLVQEYSYHDGLYTSVILSDKSDQRIK